GRERKCFNEAAAIQLRKLVGCRYRPRHQDCFNEAAAIQLRKPVPVRLGVYPTVASFNEAAAIQLRKREVRGLLASGIRSASMRPQQFSCGNRRSADSRRVSRPSFNEAAAIQLRKPPHTYARARGVFGFNEAAAIQLRKP